MSLIPGCWPGMLKHRKKGGFFFLFLCKIKSDLAILYYWISLKKWLILSLSLPNTKIERNSLFLGMEFAVHLHTPQARGRAHKFKSKNLDSDHSDPIGSENPIHTVIWIKSSQWVYCSSKQKRIGISLMK